MIPRSRRRYGMLGPMGYPTAADSWRPCPRCHSARVRYQQAPPRGAWLAYAVLAVFAIPAGLALPCLWLGVPACAIAAVAVARHPGAGWHCEDCQARWVDSPPAAH